MEYTELSDYPLPSGRVTEWTLTAPDDAWATDDRRLSYTHIDHARRAVGAGANWHSEWIGTAFLIEERYDAEVLAHTMERWYARHEAFRSTATLDSATDRFARRTVDAEAVSAAHRLVGAHLSSTAVYQHIEAHFDTTVSPLRWPHCIAMTVEPDGEPDQFLFVFAADHTVMDAYTQVFAIDEVIAIYRAVLAGSADDGLPPFGSYVDFSEELRTRCADVDASAVADWRRFFDAHAETIAAQPDRMPGFPRIDTGRTAEPVADTASAHQASLSSWILDAEQTEAFHRVCKQAGATMQTGVYTALTMAAHRLVGESQLRLINPIHTRTAATWAGSAGWFVDIVPVHLHSGSATTFHDALASVGASAMEYQSVCATAYSAVARALDDPAVARAPQFVVSYIDMRVAPGAPHWTRRRARVLRSATAQSSEVYLWINRVPSGTNISARFPSGTAGAAVNDFIATLTGILRDVANGAQLSFTEAAVATPGGVA